MGSDRGPGRRRGAYGLSAMTAGLLATLAAGCSRRPADMPPLYPCTVTVINAGTPIADVQIILEPVAGSQTVTVTGKTDATGVATIRSQRLGAAYVETGAPAGSFHVSALKPPKWDGEKTADQCLAMSPEEQKAYVAAYNEAMDKLPREVPVSLAGSDRQPLDVVAGSGGSLTIDVASPR